MRALTLSLAAAFLAAVPLAGCNKIDTGAGPVVDTGRPNSDLPPTSKTPPATGTPRSTTTTAPGTTADTTPPPGTRPDNTAVNQRDADMRKTKTPIDQDEDQAALDITAKIRTRVREQDNFSVNANNIKIITGDGMTTLRGPVNSQTEHDTIVRIAKEVAGEGKVVNELEVKPQDR